jgi:hypothetical protein
VLADKRAGFVNLVGPAHSGKSAILSDAFFAIRPPARWAFVELQPHMGPGDIAEHVADELQTFRVTTLMKRVQLPRWDAVRKHMLEDHFFDHGATNILFKSLRLGFNAGWRVVTLGTGAGDEAIGGWLDRRLKNHFRRVYRDAWANGLNQTETQWWNERVKPRVGSDGVLEMEPADVDDLLAQALALDLRDWAASPDSDAICVALDTTSASEAQLSDRFVALWLADFTESVVVLAATTNSFSAGIANMRVVSITPTTEERRAGLVARLRALDEAEIAASYLLDHQVPDAQIDELVRTVELTTHTERVWERFLAGRGKSLPSSSESLGGPTYYVYEPAHSRRFAPDPEAMAGRAEEVLGRLSSTVSKGDWLAFPQGFLLSKNLPEGAWTETPQTYAERWTESERSRLEALHTKLRSQAAAFARTTGAIVAMPFYVWPSGLKWPDALQHSRVELFHPDLEQPWVYDKVFLYPGSEKDNKAGSGGEWAKCEPGNQVQVFEDPASKESTLVLLGQDCVPLSWRTDRQIAKVARSLIESSDGQQFDLLRGRTGAWRDHVSRIEEGVREMWRTFHDPAMWRDFNITRILILARWDTDYFLSHRSTSRTTGLARFAHDSLPRLTGRDKIEVVLANAARNGKALSGAYVLGSQGAPRRLGGGGSAVVLRDGPEGLIVLRPGASPTGAELAGS